MAGFKNDYGIGTLIPLKKEYDRSLGCGRAVKI